MRLINSHEKTFPPLHMHWAMENLLIFRINDLGENLRNEYRLAKFDLKAGYPDASVIKRIAYCKTYGAVYR
jgi:hypothetical protein